MKRIGLVDKYISDRLNEILRYDKAIKKIIIYYEEENSISRDYMYCAEIDRKISIWQGNFIIEGDKNLSG